jgi:hypothetical protein
MKNILMMFMLLFTMNVFAITSQNHSPQNEMDMVPTEDVVLLFVDSYHKYDSCADDIGYVNVYRMNTKQVSTLCGSHDLTPDDVGLEFKVRIF